MAGTGGASGTLRLQDFMAMLPMPEYTHPDSPMNMVSHLELTDVKPDLGPKTYVATGRCCTQCCCRAGSAAILTCAWVL